MFEFYFFGLGIFVSSMVYPILALGSAVFSGDYDSTFSSYERNVGELMSAMFIGSCVGAFIGVFVGVFTMVFSINKIEPKMQAMAKKCLSNINLNQEYFLLSLSNGLNTLAIDYTNSDMLIFTKGKEIRLKPEDIKGVIDGDGSKTMTDTPLGIGSTSWSHAEIHTKLSKHPKVKVKFDPNNPFEQKEGRDAIKRFCTQDAEFFSERLDVTWG